MMRLSLQNAIKKIDAIRGRARVRALYREDLLQALEEARTGAYGLRAGEEVANCYGYPASRMRLVAIRRRSGSYAILCNWGPAKKGCSPCPLGGHAAVWQKIVEQAKITLANTNNTEWIVIPGAEVRHALAERRRRAAQQAQEAWPPPEDSIARSPVTRADSLAAGNCPATTERVAAWWPRGTESITAGELRAHILRREPTLIPYAQRAVAKSMERSVAALSGSGGAP